MKSLFAVVGSILYIPATAQIVEECYPIGTKWVEEWFMDYEGHSSSERTVEHIYRRSVVTPRDTIIGTKTYKIVDCDYCTFAAKTPYSAIKEEDWKSSYNNMSKNFYIREDNGKVWCYSDQLHAEYLAYDFQWEVGKEIPKSNPGSGSMLIDSIGKIQLLDGIKYDFIDSKWYLEDTPLAKNPSRIRTIGNIGEHLSVFENWYIGTWHTFYEEYFHVVRFERKGVLLYEFDQLKNILSVDNVKAGVPFNNQNRVYRLDGLRVQGEPNKGVYIINGKKLFIK